MKFNLKISRLNNLYFFVSNMTEFHFSCRAHFNEEWIKATGPLTKEEKIALKDLKKIFFKYGFEFRNNESVYLGNYFFCPEEKDKWNSVKGYLLPLEYDKFTEGFKILEPRFDKLYKEELLKEWMDLLEKELNCKRFNDLYNSIKQFFNPKKDEPILNVHLLFSPSLTRTASGGANLGDNDITLEVPVFKMSEWDIEAAADILMHELAHIWFENSPVYKFSKNFATKNIHFDVIKEAIVGSTSPFGYPCQFYSIKVKPINDFLMPKLSDEHLAYKNFKSGKKTNYNQLYFYLAWLSYPLLADYFSNNKQIDKNFVERVVSLI